MTLIRGGLSGLGAVIAAGLGLRFLFFLDGLDVMPVSSDEAWPGLMALHVLKGDYPVVYWGQSYMGTVESYFQAPFIHLLGTTALAIRLYPLLIGFLYLYLSVKLAREMFGEGAAWWTALLLAVPPVYLTIATVLIPPDNYLATTALGSLAVLILHRIVRDPAGGPRAVRRHLLLGIVCGLGFWVHILFIDYLAIAVLFVWLKDKTFFLKPHGLALGAGLLGGGLPLVAYNLTHAFDTFIVARTVPAAKAIGNGWMALREIFPVLVGAVVPLYGDNPNTVSMPAGLYVAVVFLYLGLGAWLAWVHRGEWIRLARLSTSGTTGVSILAVLIVVSFVVFSRSERANSWAFRYLLPVMTAVPIIASLGLARLAERRRRPALAVGLVVLAVQVWGHGVVWAAWGDAETRARLDLPDDRPLIRYLDDNGIRRAYAHFWISYRLTYETGERIICAQPYDERFAGRYRPKYTDRVDRATPAAFITLPGLGLDPDLIEHDLKLIGGRYRRVRVPPYTLFMDFRLPDAGVPLDPAGWTVRASHNGDAARMAIDRDIFSRWGTGTAQRPGQWYEVDLGRTVPATRVGLALGRFGPDLPRGLVVEGSVDGRAWEELARADRHLGGLVWGEFHPVFDVTGRFELALPGRPVRFLRLVQTGRADPFDWSIAELFIYGPEKAADGPGQELGNRLFRDALEASEEAKDDDALVSLYRAVRADPGHASAWQRLANASDRRGIVDANGLRLEVARIYRERGLVLEADSLMGSPGKKAEASRP